MRLQVVQMALPTVVAEWLLKHFPLPCYSISRFIRETIKYYIQTMHSQYDEDHSIAFGNDL